MRRKPGWYTQKAEALEVIICENQIMTFLHEVNKDGERYTTEISLFEFWKYVQKKKENIDPGLFEKK